MTRAVFPLSMLILLKGQCVGQVTPPRQRLIVASMDGYVVGAFGNQDELFRRVVARYAQVDMAYARRALAEPTAYAVIERYREAQVHRQVRLGHDGEALNPSFRRSSGEHRPVSRGSPNSGALRRRPMRCKGIRPRDGDRYRLIPRCCAIVLSAVASPRIDHCGAGGRRAGE
ncbi:hypothetical protein AB0C34_24940 [Nocardia sp. NPDC049220]|uniref:hypothetical protein n=1 Tax=Nocardia sp. NPDC049220 TaxID=3155273 RepID=UPI0033D3AAAC